MTDTGGAVSPPADPRGSLTERELTVLHEMGDGLTAAQIADRLAISPKTVESHKQRIYSKLGAHNQSEAVAIALGAVWLIEPSPSPSSPRAEPQSSTGVHGGPVDAHLPITDHGC